jgi:hypothetical protein
MGYDTYELWFNCCSCLLIQEEELETIAEQVKDYTNKHPYDNTISDIYDTTQNILQEFLEKQMTEVMLSSGDESKIEYNAAISRDDETFLIFKVLDKINVTIE